MSVAGESHKLVFDLLKDLQASIPLKPTASTPEGPQEPLVLRAASLIISPLICWYAESGMSSTGPNSSAPKLAFCASGCFSLSCRITSSVSGKTPPLSASLRKRRAELICPSLLYLADRYFYVISVYAVGSCAFLAISTQSRHSSTALTAFQDIPGDLWLSTFGKVSGAPQPREQ